VTWRSRPGRGPRPVRGGARVHPVAALVLLAALATITWSTPPAADASSSCDGVWVVVDLSAFGGGVHTRCAAGEPRNGLQALELAGFSHTPVPGQAGMVCTIDGNPDPCNGAPADAYWSYWHAPQGGSWSYSSSGAGFRRPPPGTVDGWAFGDGSAPPAAPPPQDPPPPSPSPSPTPTSSPSPRPSPAPTSNATPEAVEDTSEPAPGATPDDLVDDEAAVEREADREAEREETVPAPGADEEPPTADAAPTAPRQPRPSPTSRPTAQGSGELPPVELRDADGDVAIGRPGDGGATAGLIAGGALAAAIAGAGMYQARRRRLDAERPEHPGIAP
jgi:hypothetical protein